MNAVLSVGLLLALSCSTIEPPSGEPAPSDDARSETTLEYRLEAEESYRAGSAVVVRFTLENLSADPLEWPTFDGNADLWRLHIDESVAVFVVREQPAERGADHQTAVHRHHGGVAGSPPVTVVQADGGVVHGAVECRPLRHTVPGERQPQRSFHDGGRGGPGRSDGHGHEWNAIPVLDPVPLDGSVTGCTQSPPVTSLPL